MNTPIVIDFTYIKADGESEQVIPADTADVDMHPEGLYYTPFYRTSNNPITMFIPNSRIVIVAMRGYK